MSLKGPPCSTKLENRVIVPKPRQKWDELDKRKAQLNANSFISYIMLLIEMNIIVYANVSWLKTFEGFLK